MKILHISNFVQKHNGRLFWNSAFKLSNGFTRLGHNVLNFSERDIARDNFLRSSIYGKKLLNERIIQVLKNYNPDLVVIGHADLVFNETLKKIKSHNSKIKIIQWNVDHPLMNNTIGKIIDKSEYISETFITNGDPTIKKAAINNMRISFIPNLFDQSIDNLEIYKNNNFEYDIFFAMSHGVGSGKLKKNKKDGREETLNKINLDHEINDNFFGINGREPIWGQYFLDEMQKSPMGINLNQGEPMYLYSSDRIASYIGNGLCTFLQSNRGLEELYNDTEAVYFQNDEELIDKIKFFKKNIEKSKKISMNGWRKSHECFNEKVICNYIISKTLNLKISNQSWPEISYV